MTESADTKFMQRALLLAQKAAEQGEVPVGAVLVHNQQIVAEGWNQSISRHDPSAHAEIMALRAGGQTLTNYRLVETSLYVTLEPCMMCYGAIVHARLARLVYAASDPKTGALGGAFDLPAISGSNHQPEVLGGVLAEQSATLLRDFFRARR